jgi:hypothetical protein
MKQVAAGTKKRRGIRSRFVRIATASLSEWKNENDASH